LDTPLFKHKALPLVILLLILILVVVLMRGPANISDVHTSDRVVPIKLDDTPSARDSIAWKPSGKATPALTPAQRVANSSSDLSAVFSSGIPTETRDRASFMREPETPESLAPSVRRDPPHDPAMISAPPWAPPAMRDGHLPSAASSIPVTHAIAYRQRIAQGEKIFTRGPDRKLGVLDGVRGRFTPASESEQTLPIYGGVR
jgi:hypothetical protein